eukprot:NODE_285_length_11794_cov_0.197178.p2 type:complete len:594 gc:universal NODE_285_length_11794_cov_0.197178:271-2052(+)
MHMLVNWHTAVALSAVPTTITAIIHQPNKICVNKLFDWFGHLIAHYLFFCMSFLSSSQSFYMQSEYLENFDHLTMEENLLSDNDLITFDLSRLVSLINALGSIELNQYNEEIYVLGDCAFDVLQDIKNILKDEELTNQRPSLKWLINKRFVETDLLPILSDHMNNKKISLSVLELLVPLTWPAHHQELQVYHKKLFANEYHLNKVKMLVVKLFSVDYRKREDRDQALLRLAMLFFRNILRIQDPRNVKNDFELVPLHEQVVVCFSNCKIFDLILKITSNLEKKEFYSWNSIILDVYDSILFNIKDLFNSNHEFSELLKSEMLSRPKLEMTSAMKYNAKVNIIGINNEVVKSVSGNLNPSISGMDRQKHLKYRRQKKYSVGLHHSTNILLKQGNQIVHKVLVDLLATGADPLISTLLRDIQSHKHHCTEESRVYLVRLIRHMLEFMIYNHKKKILEYDSVTLNWNMLSQLFSTNFIRFIMICLQSTSDEKQKYTEYALVAECFAFYVQSLQVLCQQAELLDIGKSILSKIFYDERLIQIITSMTRQARFYGYGLIKSCVILNDSIFRGTFISFRIRILQEYKPFYFHEDKNQRK